MDLALRAEVSGERMRTSGSRFAVAALVAAKLWLVAAQGVSAIGPAGHDDGLLVGLASALASGRWLGRYHQLTLANGPFYPMWIAANFALGVPLRFAEHLLYAIACGVLVAGVAPLLRNRATRVLLFGALLFNPGTYADGPMTRVIREVVYPALTLLVLGSAAGLFLRLESPRRTRLGWGTALGASLAAFWLCREERIWIAPALIALGTLSLLHRPVPWRAALRAVAVPAAVFALLVGAVEAKNLARYGAFVVTEFSEGPFQPAYAAAARVRQVSFRPRVPIPAEARARLYGASPRFAELRPFLDGDLGRGWMQASCQGAGICDDIAGGWMMWALRGAAALAGHAQNAAEAARYWRALRDEIDAACVQGRLACEPTPPGFLPQLRREYLPAFASGIKRATVALATFEGVSPYPSPSVGPEATLAPFRDLTRSPLAPVAGESASLPHQASLDAQKIRILEWAIAFYRAATPVLAVLGMLAFAAAAGGAVARWRVSPHLLVGGALLASIATRLVLLALVDATSFSAVNTLYLSPAYPLVFAFVGVAGVAALEMAQGGARAPVPSDGTGVAPSRAPADTRERA